MIWISVRRYLTISLVCFTLVAVEFADWTVSGTAPGWMRFVGIEIQAVFRDPGTQWMGFLCAGIYFATFSVLGTKAEKLKAEKLKG